MITFLRTIRWINLLIILATMAIVKYAIIEPLLGIKEIDSHLPTSEFLLIMLATLLISAAGYVINDYFDIEIDKVNKPQQKHFTEKTLNTLYWLLNLSGLAVATYLYYYFKNSNILILFLFVSGTLWFYSSQYKQQLIVGNIIVAFLTALVPLMVLWFEMYIIGNLYSRKLYLLNISLNYIVWWVAGFSFFAFLLTLIREIVKDIEDFEGDNAFGCKSIAVVWGVNTAKIISIILIVFVIVAILLLFFKYLFDAYTLVYVSMLLVLPLIYCIYKLVKAKNHLHFKNISFLLKTIMVAGLGYAFVAWYIIEIKM